METEIKASQLPTEQTICGWSPPAPCSQLVVVPLDTAPESLAEIRAAGYVPIMTDSPEKVKMIMPGNNVVGGDLLMAAMHGLMAESDAHTALYMRSRAMAELYRRLKSREAETANGPAQ